MQISAKADYAVRAVLELAAVAGDEPVKGEHLASIQHIPPKFLETILTSLRQQGLLASRRGADGGYWLARPADVIVLGDIIRATDGPLASVRGEPPESVRYGGAAEHLGEAWVLLQASLGAVLDHVTVQDVLDGTLSEEVRILSSHPEARTTR